MPGVEKSKKCGKEQVNLELSM